MAHRRGISILYKKVRDDYLEEVTIDQKANKYLFEDGNEAIILERESNI